MLPNADTKKLYRAQVLVMETASAPLQTLDLALEASTDGITWTQIANNKQQIREQDDPLMGYARFPLDIIPGPVGLNDGDTLHIRAMGSGTFTTSADFHINGETDPGQITLLLQECQP